jgi:hypothetical protein
VVILLLVAILATHLKVILPNNPGIPLKGIPNNLDTHLKVIHPNQDILLNQYMELHQVDILPSLDILLKLVTHRLVILLPRLVTLQLQSSQLFQQPQLFLLIPRHIKQDMLEDMDLSHATQKKMLMNSEEP